MKTIDITPTWQQALNIYLMALEAGTSKGKQEAIKGLQQMADVAQIHADQVKACPIKPSELLEALKGLTHLFKGREDWPEVQRAIKLIEKAKPS